MSDEKTMLTSHHDISGFCVTDKSRYVLAGVHYDAKHKRLEATDGRILVYLPVIENDENIPPIKGLGKELASSCIIPAEILGEALEVILKSSTLEPLKRVVLDTPDSSRVLLTTTDLDTDRAFYAKCIEGDFPNTQTLIDGYNKPVKFKMSLGPRFLKALADYACQHARDKDQLIEFEFTGDTDPVHITVPLKDGNQLKALLMPIRTA